MTKINQSVLSIQTLGHMQENKSKRSIQNRITILQKNLIDQFIR